MNIQLFNTLTKKKEILTPHAQEPLKLYVCGITPYDYAHIGHGRVYVTFDVLVRLLRFLSYPVTYVRNITDIDDKLITKAQQQGKTYQDVADFFIKHFHQDTLHLNCLQPDHEPRVTAYIADIIAFIVKLIEKKHAYVLDHDVYFDIASFPAYGKLSKRNLDDMLAGARVDVNDKKKHPADFALWKGNTDGQFWQSPWGYGRPGWHIECSVMANKLLGSTLDIHGGGMDLIFPHHENEIAQSESLHDKQLATIWMHNAFVNINKEKMSKSLGNIIALHTILQTKDPMVLRFFYLQHHYRTPIDYSDDELEATQTAYKKLINHLEGETSKQATFSSLADYATTNPVAQAMLAALCDDLNTPKFLGLIFEHLAALKDDQKLRSFVYTLLHTVLGLTLQPIKEKTIAITPEIETLIKQREQARHDKNWALADQLRDKLKTLGYEVQDKKLK